MKNGVMYKIAPEVVPREEKFVLAATMNKVASACTGVCPSDCEELQSKSFEDCMSNTTSPPASTTSPTPELATQSAPRPNPQGNGSAENGVLDFEDNKPALALVDRLEDWDNFEDMEKYRKYEADYTRCLMNKYFSKQTLYGGDIFDERVTIDGEVIQSSRWPCTRSYADPVNSFHEMHGNSLNSILEANSTITNGKHSLKKIG